MAVFALLVVTAAPVSAKKWELKAEIAGTLTANFGPNGPTSAFYEGEGSETSLGTATMAGDITILGPAACPGGFTATHTDVLSGDDGSVTVQIAETSCPRPGPGPGLVVFDCEGTFEITGGTGSFKNQKGKGKWEGTLLLNINQDDTENFGKGTFTAEYSE